MPSKGVLSLFYPVFNLGTAIVDRNYFVRLKIRVGHNESDTGEEFTHVPFDFIDNPSGLIPTFSLVMELDHSNLYPALWGTAGGALQVRQDATLEAVVAGKPNKVSDRLLFAKFAEVWTGKCSIAP